MKEIATGRQTKENKERKGREESERAREGKRKEGRGERQRDREEGRKEEGERAMKTRERERERGKQPPVRSGAVLCADYPSVCFCVTCSSGNMGEVYSLEYPQK